MPANSAPPPVRATGARRPDPAAAAPRRAMSNGADAGSTLISAPCSSTGPQRYPAHGLVSATRSSPSVRRPQRRGLTSSTGTPSRTSPPTRPDGRVQGDVRRLRADAGHVLDAVGLGHVQPRAGALALVERDVVEPGPHDRDARGPVHQPERRHDDQRRRQHHQHGLAEQHGAADAAARRPAGRGSGRACPPTPLMTANGAARTPRASTASAPTASTASTTRRPLAWVIQSSGLTVIRCDSTDRATALTSSGMT